jgi:hypothetical protein
MKENMLAIAIVIMYTIAAGKLSYILRFGFIEIPILHNITPATIREEVIRKYL